MNFQECFNILNHRMQNHVTECSCCKRTNPINSNEPLLPPAPPSSSEKTNIVTETSFSSMCFDKISHQIVNIQQDRLKTYRRYNEELSSIVMNDQIHLYPNICRHYTDIFSNLSEHMIKIREELRARGEYQNLVELIEKLQSAEKEKLLMVAASHLEKLKEKLPVLQESLGGECEIQNRYLREKLEKLDESISEFTEEIICCRIDILERETAEHPN